MENGLHDLPLCSRLLARDEIAQYLRLATMRAGFSDFAANALCRENSPFDRGELGVLRDEAGRHRDFVWSILPGDKVWLTAEPRRHPEVEHGMPYLVVVRNAAVVFRYRLGDWTEAGPGSNAPVLAPTMRLTRDEVVTIASDWVATNYSVVPAVVSIQEFSDRTIDQLERQMGKTFPPDERRGISNKWWVSFACSWETDAAGLPTSLQVLVDDVTGQAKRDAPGD
jgi:hypothetical protein